MRLAGKSTLFLAASILAALASFVGAAPDSDLHAIVERNGTVVLCLSKGQFLFADRCSGTGRLSIVQPIQEGEIAWRTAIGTITIESESPQNPDCALSRAKWNPQDEQAVPSGKTIRIIDPAWVLAQLDTKHPGLADLTEGDFTAFALDLDNDGRDEIIFSASNIERLEKVNDKTGQELLYVVWGGILRGSSRFPHDFYFDQGRYLGGTDAIGDVSFKGVVPIAADDIALLVVSGTGFRGLQDLIRFRGEAQRIETIQRRCD
jgi:hypothetical protein